MIRCKQLISEMNEVPTHYQPTAFWREASEILFKSLTEQGLENFRSIRPALIFFVPTYGIPGNGFSSAHIDSLQTWSTEQSLTAKQSLYLEDFTTGKERASADYRTLVASEYLNSTAFDLMKFSESEIGNPIEHFEFDGRKYSRSAFNYLLGLAFLKKHINLAEVSTVLEIGGGFGTLGEIVYKVAPKKKYINIDIPPTACCSSYYLTQLAGEANVTTYKDTKDKSEIAIDKLTQLNVLPSWQIENLEGEVDLFVNFISFQEMEPEIVENYLSHVRRLNTQWILLRNLREGKPLKINRRFGVDTPIYSEDYIKMLPDYELLDTNVMPFGFKTVDGFHSELMLFKRIVKK